LVRIYSDDVQSVYSAREKGKTKLDEEHPYTDIPVELYSNLMEVDYGTKEVHRIIAEEMLRILPSWPERAWLWVKSKVN
jgi:hypothetical protein